MKHSASRVSLTSSRFNLPAAGKARSLAAMAFMAATLLDMAGVQAQVASPPPSTMPSMPPAVTKARAQPMFTVPRRMTPVELERFATWMKLSEPQRELFEAGFRKYDAAWERFLEVDVPPLNEVTMEGQRERMERTRVRQPGEEAYKPPPARSAMEDYEQYASHMNAIKEAVVPLNAAETQMFEQLTSVLSDEQVPLRQRAIWERERTEGCFWAALIPGASVDLVTLIRRMKFDDELMERLDPILAEYEAAYSPLISAGRKVIDDSHLQVVREIAVANDSGRDISNLPIKRQYDERITDNAVRLRETNLRSLKQLQEAMSEDEAWMLTQKFWFESDELHPLIPNPQKIVDAAIKHAADHELEAHDALMEVRKSFRTSFDEIHGQIDERRFHWREHCGRQGGTHFKEMAAVRKKLEPLYLRLQEVCEKAVISAKSLLGAETVAAIPEFKNWTTMWERRIIPGQDEHWTTP